MELLPADIIVDGFAHRCSHTTYAANNKQQSHLILWPFRLIFFSIAPNERRRWPMDGKMEETFVTRIESTYNNIVVNAKYSILTDQRRFHCVALRLSHEII